MCGQTGEQSGSQPTPSVCLCANAVLKWAHYHQREHKHSSRKQDSLCQEREPLPQAHCRPDEITRLKIRQGSYYYCRHAPQAATPLLKKTIHTAAQTFPFIFFSDCSLCFSPLALRLCCKLQGVQGVFLSELIHKFHLLSHGSSGKFDGAIGSYRDCHYSLIEVPAISRCQYIIHKSPF